MALQDTQFFLNLFKAIKDFNRDPGKIRTNIGDKGYFKKDITKLLKRLPQFKTYWNIPQENDLIRKVYSDFWVERKKDLVLLTSRQDPILTPQAHQEFEAATSLPEPQKDQALDNWLNKYVASSPPVSPPGEKPLPPINPLTLIPKPPEAVKQAALNTASTAQIKTKKWLSRIKPGAILSYLGQAVFGGEKGTQTSTLAGAPPAVTLPNQPLPSPPSTSPTSPPPASSHQTKERSYSYGLPASKRFETPSILKDIASSLQIKAGRAISRYGRLKFITSLAFGGAGGGLTALRGGSPWEILGSSALGFGFPNFVTSRVGGTLLRGGGGLAFKAGSKAALGAIPGVGTVAVLASSDTGKRIIKYVAIGIGAFVLFFLIQGPFDLSKGTALLLQPEYGEAAPLEGDPPGGYPPPGPPPTDGSMFSCPVPGARITCGTRTTPVYYDQEKTYLCGHCDAIYTSRTFYANLCRQYPYNAQASDVAGPAGSPVYLPYIGGQVVDWYYIHPESKSSGEMIKGFTTTVGGSKYYLQLHHLRSDGTQANLNTPIKSGQVAGQICTNSDCNHVHVQLSLGANLWESQASNSWLDTTRYLSCNKILP